VVTGDVDVGWSSSAPLQLPVLVCPYSLLVAVRQAAVPYGSVAGSYRERITQALSSDYSATKMRSSNYSPSVARSLQ
jgi:hypothetical protein